MITQTEKIIEEYVFWIPKHEFTIKGRVSEIISPESKHCYTWTVSHYYRPSESTPAYIPSIITANSLDEAKQHLFAYINGYSGIAPSPNAYY